MKSIVLISLILAATASLCIAAETQMTIQTNTTIRIDPVTGQVKGDTHTQIKGVKKRDEVPPDTVNTLAGGTASANTDPVSTPAAVTAPADGNVVSTPVAAASPTDPNTGTTAVGTASPASPCSVCPSAQVSGGQQN